jgi:hypothetical protein
MIVKHASGYSHFKIYDEYSKQNIKCVHFQRMMRTVSTPNHIKGSYRLYIYKRYELYIYIYIHIISIDFLLKYPHKINVSLVTFRYLHMFPIGPF